jgi:hypothetical protein
VTWTAFPTLTDGQVLTGAHMQLIQANFAETVPAKATTAGRIFVSTAANTIAERVISTNLVASADTTTSATFTGLAGGPAVTATTSTMALVFLSAAITNNTLGAKSYMGCVVSSASTIAATDANSLMLQVYGANAEGRATALIPFTTLTAGSNVFTAQYRTSNPTASYSSRALTVIAL